MIETQKRLPILWYSNAANYVTMFGCLLSLASCYFAVSGNLKLSVTCFILAGVCDLFDGFVARKIQRTDEEKKFGIALDTVVDVVSFAVTPVVIVCCVEGMPWYSLIIGAFYIAAAVVRLAYFTASTHPEHRKWYAGLPVTYIALILPIVLLIGWSPLILAAVLVTGVLFVVGVPIPKPRGVWYGVFPVIAIALIVLTAVLIP